ncbi:MAG: hypothetical protein KF746_18325 [Chitinophagaceae bacterium]|nr:hypothetical protein [Chitinophagaceae bacterium]
MERNIYMDDEFEKLLKEKADQYKLYPSDKVWSNIQRSLRPQRKWPYITLTILLLLGTSVIVDHPDYSNGVSGYRFAPLQTLSVQDNTTQQPASQHAIAVPPENIHTPGIQIQAFAAASGSSGFASNNRIGLLQTEKVEAPEVATTVNTSLEEIADEFGDIPVKEVLSTINKLDNKTRIVTTANKEEEQETNTIKKVLWGGEVFRKSKLSWQISFSPTVSYRRLTSGIQDITEVFRGVPASPDRKVSSVDKSVTQKPAIGVEVGAGLTYNLTQNFLVKAGLQLNYSRYQLSALPVKQSDAILAVQGTDSITVPSTLLNYAGRGASWLNNEYYQLSMPVGIEWGVLGNSTFKWNVAASAQPVYNFANNVYLLSTDFKQYGQDPSLVRRWNINAGVETFVSYNLGSFKMQAGPQLRYQLISSYKKPYPIKEYMVDFGFKIGVTKTLH